MAELSRQGMPKSVASRDPVGTGRTPNSEIIRYFNITVIGTLGFFITHSLFIYLTAFNAPFNTIINLFIWLGGIILFSAWTLYKTRESDETTGLKSADPTSLPFRWAVYLILVIVAVLIIWFTDVNLVRANNYARAGRLFLKTNNPALAGAAREHYQTAIRLAPDPNYHYADLAELYRVMAETARDPAEKLKYTDEAIRYLKECIKYEPLSYNRNANIGRIYRFRLMFIREPTLREAEIKLAEEYYGKAFELCPTNPALVNEWGEFYLELGNYTKAGELFERALKMAPNFALTYAHLGDLYLNLKNYQEAGKAYEQAAKLYLNQPMWTITINPNYEILFVRTGEQLIKYQPQNYLGYYLLTIYYGAKGDSDRCRTVARAGLEKSNPLPRDIRQAFQNYIEKTGPETR